MNQLSLQTLTWGTIGAAVASALWLASAGDDGLIAGRDGAPSMLRAPATMPGATLRRHVVPDQRDGRAAATRERRPVRPSGS